MKAPAKTETTTAEFRIWCEHCCIRIAPQSERTLVQGKAYHPQCYSKATVATTRKAKG